MIEVRGLTKRYGGLAVLRAVDVTVASGRVTALLGPNAAGKTTLLKILLGLTRPDSGSLSFDGQPITGNPEYRARIGYMPQFPHFPDNLTAREVIAMVCDVRQAPVAGNDELIDTLGVRPELDKRIGLLSGGTRQKINAMIAFLFRPDLLVLDEPTAGLDPLASSVLKARILAERARGQSCIITSHILSDLDELADDVVFLLGGRVRFAGTAQAMKAATGQATIEGAMATILRQRAMAAT